MANFHLGLIRAMITTGLRLKLIVIGLLLLCLFGGGCASAPDFDCQLTTIIKPYRFSIVQWESKTLTNEAKLWFSGKHEESAERIISRQITETLARRASSIQWLTT